MGQQTGVDLADDVTVGSGRRPEQGVRRAADVEHRHGDEHRVPVAVLDVTHGVAGVHEHVVLAEDHALGAAGRARAVHDEAGVVRFDVLVAVDGFRRREEGLVLVVLPADDDDPLDRRQPVADQLDRRHQLVSDEQDTGAGVVDDVVELVAGEAPVDDGVGAPEQAGGLGGGEDRRVVLVEGGDAVAAADAHGCERTREAADVVPRLGPGPRPVQVGPAASVALVLGAVRMEVGQEGGGGDGDHRISWSVRWLTPG